MPHLAANAFTIHMLLGCCSNSCTEVSSRLAAEPPTAALGRVPCSAWEAQARVRSTAEQQPEGRSGHSAPTYLQAASAGSRYRCTCSPYLSAAAPIRPSDFQYSSCRAPRPQLLQASACCEMLHPCKQPWHTTQRQGREPFPLIYGFLVCAPKASCMDDGRPLQACLSSDDAMMGMHGCHAHAKASDAEACSSHDLGRSPR